LQAAIELAPIGETFRLFLVGDSHCLAARDLLAADAFTGRNYIVVSKYIPGFSAGAFMKGGKLTPDLLTALESENLVRDGQFSFSSLSHQELSTNFIAGATGSPPVLILTLGEIDLRGGFLSKLADKYDIVLPYETPYAVRKGAKIMPYAVARQMAQDMFAPLVQGLLELRKMGLPRVLVMELPPPTLDQERFDALNGFSCPIDTRYKAALLFNEILKEGCAKAGAAVVNVWPEVIDERGYLRREFELDGVHLNRLASLRSLRQILAAAINEGRQFCVNRQRYELAYKLRETSVPEPASASAQLLAREFHEHGICRTAISPEAAARIADALEYEHDVGNRHARLDWAGDSVTPFSPFVRAAAPDQDTLDFIYGTLYSTELASVMRLCMGSDVWYANCRAFMSMAHQSDDSGPQALHYDGCPPHVLRAIIYLVDVDEENGPFEYIAEDGTTQHVLGPRGTMFIFDATRLPLRAPPPPGWHRQWVDFVILPRMKSQPRRLLWAGMNNWPGDPFLFSINGMRASPSCADQILRTNPLTG
jgi:lysophospholipase L1-like esterase